jgi:tetratricopeptide (TPR) repeat protein
MVEAEPSNWKWRMERASARIRRGDKAGADADAARAAELARESAGMHLSHAKFLLETNGEVDRALHHLGRAIELDSVLAEAYEIRGELLRDMRRLSEAILDATKLIELGDPRGRGSYHRGRARRETGDLAEALEDFTRAIERDPAHKHSRVYRAKTLEKPARPGKEGERERLAQADLDYEKALQIGGPAWDQSDKIEGSLESVRRRLKAIESKP